MTASAFTSSPETSGHRQSTQCDPKHNDLRGRDVTACFSGCPRTPTHPISYSLMLDNEVGMGSMGSIKNALALSTFLCRTHGRVHILNSPAWPGLFLGLLYETILALPTPWSEYLGFSFPFHLPPLKCCYHLKFAPYP